MRLLIYSMPLIALMMIITNYSYQLAWPTELPTMYDHLAMEIHKTLQLHHDHASASKPIVAIVMQD